MGLFSSKIRARDEALATAHQPSADIPANDVQRAIKHVFDWFAALVPAAGAAPKDAQYLVAASDGTLTAERVATDTTSIKWNVATAGQVKAERAALTGDVSASQDSNETTLATVNANVGSFGSISAVATFTVDAKGRLTAAGSAAIQIAISAVTGLQTVLDDIALDIAALDQAVILKGIWDASAGTFPGAGAAQAGWSYIVSVGGTVDGQVFAANDRIVAIFDNASTSTYAANWHKLDYTDQVLSVDGATGAVSLSSTYRNLTAQKRSIESDAGDLQLVGDEASPGNNQVYGTDSSGNKGWKTDPGGVSTGKAIAMAIVFG